MALLIGIGLAGFCRRCVSCKGGTYLVRLHHCAAQSHASADASFPVVSNRSGHCTQSAGPMFSQISSKRTSRLFADPGHLIDAATARATLIATLRFASFTRENGRTGRAAKR